MDNRNRGRNPRRRREYNGASPTQRMEERRRQLRSYGGFSFVEPDDRRDDYDRRRDDYDRRRDDYDRRRDDYDRRRDDYDRRRDDYDRRRDDYDRRNDDYGYASQQEYAPCPVMPPYPGGMYPSFDPFSYMSEEDYNEFMELEEYEDRYGRDFDRYDGPAPQPQPEPEPEPAPKPEPLPEPEPIPEPLPSPQPEESICDFEDDFDDEPAPPPSRVNRERAIPPQPVRREEQPPRRPREETAPAQPVRRPVPPPQQREEQRRPAPASRPSAPAVPEAPPQPASTPMTKFLAAAAVVMCLLCGWIVSSGHIMEETGVRKTQRMAAFDLQTGLDSLSVNVLNDVKGLPKVYTLPLSETPANKPRESGYSSYEDDKGVRHDTYTDDTISVDVSRSKYTVGKYTVIANVAKIKIAHPTQLRSAFAGGEFGSTRTRLSKLAQTNNAIVGINGELYNHTGRNNILIRQGTMYRDTAKDFKTLFIDSNGDFLIKSAKEAVDGGILNNPENKIYQTVSFGPALVIDGEQQSRKDDDTHFSYRNPRSAIGQTGPLEYLLVSVEGRSDESKGLNTNHLAMLMYELGCIQAYNLDGGQSSEIVFNGKPYNHISNSGERQFSDLLYFGTALPEE